VSIASSDAQGFVTGYPNRAASLPWLVKFLLDYFTRLCGNMDA